MVVGRNNEQTWTPINTDGVVEERGPVSRQWLHHLQVHMDLVQEWCASCSLTLALHGSSM